MGSKCRTIQILVVLVVIEPGNYFLDSFNAFNVRLTRSVTSLSLIGKLINQFSQLVILLFKYLQNTFIPKPYELEGLEMLRECSPPSMCHMSHVMCHMSCVTCNGPHVTCHTSHITHNFIYFIYFLQSGEVSRCRVCYQRGLPRLVYKSQSL